MVPCKVCQKAQTSQLTKLITSGLPLEHSAHSLAGEELLINILTQQQLLSESIADELHQVSFSRFLACAQDFTTPASAHHNTCESCWGSSWHLVQCM